MIVYFIPFYGMFRLFKDNPSGIEWFAFGAFIGLFNFWLLGLLIVMAINLFV